MKWKYKWDIIIEKFVICICNLYYNLNFKKEFYFLFDLSFGMYFKFILNIIGLFGVIFGFFGVEIRFFGNVNLWCNNIYRIKININ